MRAPPSPHLGVSSGSVWDFIVWLTRYPFLSFAVNPCQLADAGLPHHTCKEGRLQSFLPLKSGEHFNMTESFHTSPCLLAVSKQHLAQLV